MNLVNEDGEVIGSVFADAPVLYSFYTPHAAVQLDCGTEMITKQEFKDECDINNILFQFTTKGMIDHINKSPANFLDLPDMSDFQESLAIIEQSEAAFASLPSKVRDKYSNDPALFLRALSDPGEKDFLTEVGVFQAPVTPVTGISRPEPPTGGSPAAAGGGAET